MVSPEELKTHTETLYGEKKQKIHDLLGAVLDPPAIEVKVLELPNLEGLTEESPAATTGPADNPAERTIKLHYPYFEKYHDEHDGKHDDGALNHEFAHATQRCPIYNRDPSNGELTAWLIEGIADYVREVLRNGDYESKISYAKNVVSQKGYSQNIAHFLLWIENNFDNEGFLKLSKEINGDHVEKDSVTYKEDESFDRIYGFDLDHLTGKYQFAHQYWWIAGILKFFRLYDWWLKR